MKIFCTKCEVDLDGSTKNTQCVVGLGGHHFIAIEDSHTTHLSEENATLEYIVRPAIRGLKMDEVKVLVDMFTQARKK